MENIAPNQTSQTTGTVSESKREFIIIFVGMLIGFLTIIISISYGTNSIGARIDGNSARIDTLTGAVVENSRAVVENSGAIFRIEGKQDRYIDKFNTLIEMLQRSEEKRDAEREEFRAIIEEQAREIAGLKQKGN